MKTRTAVCTALLAITALLTACSSSGDAQGNPAACKAAMTKQFEDTVKAGAKATPGDQPDACKGVDTKTVQKYATEIMRKQIEDGVKDLETAQP
jgi:hypothetical protein